MSLYRTSRYADRHSRDLMLVSQDRTQTRTLIRRPPAERVAKGFHIWRAGDRIDRVAHWALGDPQQAWQILDANPEILNPLTIKPGTRIRIP